MRRHVVDGRVRVIGELTAVALDRAERRDVSLIGAMLRITVAADRSRDDDRGVPRVGRVTGRARSRTARRSRPTRCPTAVDLARRYLPYRAFPGKAMRLLEELRVAHDHGRDASGDGAVLGDARAVRGVLVGDRHPDRAARRQARARARRRDRRAAPPHGRPGRGGARASPRRSASRRRGCSRPTSRSRSCCSSARAASARPSSRARVAAYLFGAPDRMVRLDMSEYTDPWAAERLFGGDAGRRRPADRGGAQPAVRRRAARRDREGAPVGVRPAAASARRGAADRRPRPHDVLPQRDHRADVEPRHAQRAAARSASRAPRRDDEREDAPLPRRRARRVPARARQPARSDRRVPPARAEPRSRSVAEIAIAPARRAPRPHAERRAARHLAGRARARSPRAASPPSSARARCAATSTRELLAPAARLLAKRRRRRPRRHADRPRAGRSRRPLGASRWLAASASIDRRRCAIALWRRAAATGRRMVRSALALGELRRETDRELALAVARRRARQASASSRARSRPPRASGRRQDRAARPRDRAADRPSTRGSPALWSPRRRRRRASCAPPRSCASRRSRATSTRSI